MTTDIDPRVAEAMRLHKIAAKSHHVWQTLRALGEYDDRAQIAAKDHAALMVYLATEFAKGSSAPVDAAPTQDQRAALRELAEEAQELGMGYEAMDQIRRIPLPPERDPIAKAWQFPLDAPAKTVPLTQPKAVDRERRIALATITLPPERDPIAKAWQFPLTQTEHEVMERALRRSVVPGPDKDAEIARLTAELADEKAVNETQRSELQDRVQKQRVGYATPPSPISLLRIRDGNCVSHFTMPAAAYLPDGDYQVYVNYAGLTQPRPVVLSNAEIREIMLEHGFTVKEGQTDLKPYVYEAARALLSAKPKPKGEHHGG